MALQWDFDAAKKQEYLHMPGFQKSSVPLTFLLSPDPNVELCRIARGTGLAWIWAGSLSLYPSALFKPYEAVALNNITPDLALPFFYEWAACQVIREDLS